MAAALQEKPVRRREPSDAAQAENVLVARLDRFASLFDDRFGIPGTKLRFGLDSVLGLIPGVGDAVTGAMSLYLLWEAGRTGVGVGTLAKMAGVSLVDASLGAVPVVGDLFDLFFKSNRRNVNMLRDAIRKRRAKGS